MKPARTPIRNVVSRALRPARIFCVAALMAAPLVAVLATAPAGAGAPVSLDLMTVGGASLTAGGNTWLVTAHYSGYTEALGSDIGFAVERILPGNKGQEFHSWAASALGSTFTFNATSGKATLNSGKSLSPVASLNLTFSPAKKVMTRCSFGTSETVYTGTLKGSVHIVTGTRPVSITLASKAASFTKGGATTLTVDPCISFPCTGDSWVVPEKAASSGPAFGTVEAAGSGVYLASRLHYDVAVTRMTQLSKSPSFIRDDGAISYVSTPKWNRVTAALTVNASGIVTGSGVLTGGRAFTTPNETCLIAGKQHKEHFTEYIADAKLSKWKAFVAHTVLSGTLTASSKGVGGIQISTVS